MTVSHGLNISMRIALRLLWGSQLQGLYKTCSNESRLSITLLSKLFFSMTFRLNSGEAFDVPGLDLLENIVSRTSSSLSTGVKLVSPCFFLINGILSLLEVEPCFALTSGMDLKLVRDLMKDFPEGVRLLSPLE